MLGFSTLSETPLSTLPGASQAPPPTPEFGWHVAPRQYVRKGLGAVAALAAANLFLPANQSVAAPADPSFGWHVQAKPRALPALTIRTASFIARDQEFTAQATPDFSWYAQEVFAKYRLARTQQVAFIGPDFGEHRPLGWLAPSKPVLPPKLYRPLSYSGVDEIIAGQAGPVQFNLAWYASEKTARYKLKTTAPLGLTPQQFVFAPLGWLQPSPPRLSPRLFRALDFSGVDESLAVSLEDQLGIGWYVPEWRHKPQRTLSAVLKQSTRCFEPILDPPPSGVITSGVISGNAHARAKLGGNAFLSGGAAGNSKLVSKPAGAKSFSSKLGGNSHIKGKT